MFVYNYYDNTKSNKGVIVVKKEVIETIKQRRSIRKYENRKISKDILKDLVDCARLAPTGYNNQPWTFVVVEEQELRDEIANKAKYGKFIHDAGACIAVFCEEDAETAIEDACAATENIMIAAKAYDLGTCWVNSHQKAHSEAVKELLNCPREMELMTLIAVGYPAESEKNISKKSLDQVLEWNSF
jgi:nitroreductase